MHIKLREISNTIDVRKINVRLDQTNCTNGQIFAAIPIM